MHVDGSCLWCIAHPLMSKLLLIRTLNCECTASPTGHVPVISRSRILTSFSPPIFIFFLAFQYHCYRVLSQEDFILSFKSKVYLIYLGISFCILAFEYLFKVKYPSLLKHINNVSFILRASHQKRIALFTPKELRSLTRMTTLAGWYIVIEPLIVFIFCLVEWFTSENIPYGRRIFAVFCNHIIFFSMTSFALLILFYTKIYSCMLRHLQSSSENEYLFAMSSDAVNSFGVFARFYTCSKTSLELIVQVLSLPMTIIFVIYVFISVIATAISIDLVSGRIENGADIKEGVIILLHLVKSYAFLVFVLMSESTLSRQVSFRIIYGAILNQQLYCIIWCIDSDLSNHNLFVVSIIWVMLKHSEHIHKLTMNIDKTCIQCIIRPFLSKLILMKTLNCECTHTTTGPIVVFSLSPILVTLCPTLLFFLHFIYH